MNRVEKFLKRINYPLEKVRRSGTIVPSYQVGDNGKTVCVPIVEKNLRCSYDGKSFEIANLMYGSMPENLAQIDMLDAMDSADKITSECVRRFGTLEKQRIELEKMEKENNN